MAEVFDFPMQEQYQPEQCHGPEQEPEEDKKKNTNVFT